MPSERDKSSENPYEPPRQAPGHRFVGLKQFHDSLEVITRWAAGFLLLLLTPLFLAAVAAYVFSNASTKRDYGCGA